MLGGAWAPLRVPGMLAGVELLVFDQLERGVVLLEKFVFFFGGLGPGTPSTAACGLRRAARATALGPLLYDMELTTASLASEISPGRGWF